MNRECDSDGDCGTSTPCRQVHCVAHKCETDDTPDGVDTPNFTGSSLTCQRLVCDGHGGTRALPDPSALPTQSAPACKKYACDATGHTTVEPDPNHLPKSSDTPCKRATCDAQGNAVISADPTNVPADTPHDCKVDQCDANGNVTFSANPSDVPVDHPGDCKKDSCNAQGGATQVNDDGDPPPPTTCFSYSCSSGTAKATPINPTKSCSTLGFVCGADGQCATCPTPDAACTDPGPGSRSPSSAYDFGGIGRTDTGGRYLCGAVPAGQSAYYTYYDDGTGFLASFDPYFEVRPQIAANMCVYFDCASVSCPAGTTASTLSGHPGCCWNAAAGVYTGHAIDFCAGARVTIKVSTAATCAGYELHFHD